MKMTHTLRKTTRIITVYLLFSVLFSVSSGFNFLDNELGIKTVVIDAGHGGHDTGCLGASAKEKDVALAIALKLGKAIEDNFENVKVVYTRKTDVFIELHERAKIANDHNADLFICVHANANDNHAAYGTETFVMGLHKSQANLNVAKRENSSILMENNYETQYEGFDPNIDESYIALSLMQSAFLEQSLSFAAKIQQQFSKIGRKNRGVKQAGFLVLYRTTMPSVLIETGFLTNAEEEKFLSDEKSQSLVANSIFEAFKNYKAEVEGRKIVQEKVDDVAESEEEPVDLENSSNDVEADNSKVIYRVQVVSSSTRIELKPNKFKGFETLYEYQSGGKYKYTVGAAYDMESIQKVQEEARKKGYKDAFIIAFHEGKRISVSKAKEITKK